jgi:uncharacterized membrane protein
MKKIILFHLFKRGLGGFKIYFSEKPGFFLGLIILFSSCNLNNAPGVKTPGSLDSIKISRDTQKVAIKEYDGLYNLRTMTFRACENDSVYSIFSEMSIDSAIAKIDYFETVFMSIKGYKKYSANRSKLIATELLKVEQKSYKNTCIPYNYWCFGTEPFWQIEISEKENVIDFYNPMEQKFIHFEYSKPEIKNGSTTYSSSDKENKISIIIKKEKCNGAIDPQYDYSVQVTLNDKKYAGCASSPFIK